jgi:hypothetical protein
MRRTCSTRGREICAENFNSETLRDGLLGRINIDARIILKWIIKRRGFKGVDWIYLAYDMICYEGDKKKKR